MTSTQETMLVERGPEVEPTTRSYGDFLADQGLEDGYDALVLYTGALAANLSTIDKDGEAATIIGPDVLATQRALPEPSPIPRHTA